MLSCTVAATSVFCYAEQFCKQSKDSETVAHVHDCNTSNMRYNSGLQSLPPSRLLGIQLTGTIHDTEHDPVSLVINLAVK